MKRVLKFLQNHIVLILFLIVAFLYDMFIFLIALYDDFLATMFATPLVIGSPLIIIYSGMYVFWFFRRENFLTPLLPLVLISLGKARISVVGGMFWAWWQDTHLALITFLICLFMRLTAIILVRIYKAKLQNWTGEEKITSDVVFWVKVLFKKLMKSINPNWK